MLDYRRKSNLGMNTMEQTEAQWAADSRVFDVNVVLVCTDGSNQGKHKMADGLNTWAQLSFVDTGGGGGGQLTADELAAINGAASPSAANVVVTTSALTAGLATKEDLFVQFFQATIDGVLHNFKPNFIIGGKMSWVADEDATAVFFYDNSGPGFWKLDIGPSGVAVASDAGDEADPTEVPSWDLTGITLVVGPQVYGPTSQEAIEALAESVSVEVAAKDLTGNTLWVDAVYGNNSRAMRGRSDRPYKTCAAARTASLSGDLIHVRSGAYATTTNLAKNGVNWHFDIGAVVTMAMDDNGSIFDDENTAMTFTVTGHGAFVRDEVTQVSEFANVLHMEHASSVIVFNAASSLNAAIEESGEGLAGTAAIFHKNGSLTLNCPIIEAYSHAYYWVEGPAWINGRTIRSNGTSGGNGDAVLCRPPSGNADNVYIHANEIRSLASSAVYTSLALSTAPDFRLWITSDVIAGAAYGLQHGSGKVYVTAQKISASVDGGIVIRAGSDPDTELYVNTQKMGSADSLTAIASAFVFIEGAGAKTRVECMEYDLSSVTAWESSSALFSINSDGPLDFEANGGTVDLPDVVDTAVIANSASTGGGRRVFKGMRIDNSAAGGSASPPVVITDSLTILEGMVIVTAAPASIDAATALNVTSYASYADTAVDGDVTVQGLLTVGAYVE